MTATVTVAPREIHDLVYRASRVAGCDPGSAERIADNVTFAQIHHGAAVRVFCRALDDVDLPRSAWATAPDTLLAAEVAARTGGAASAVFDPGVPLAAIVGTLHQSLERGVAPVGINGQARGDTTVDVVEMHGVDDESAAASRERTADTRNNAHRLGVVVDTIWFGRLEAAAGRFLVAEATLDEID